MRRRENRFVNGGARPVSAPLTARRPRARLKSVKGKHRRKKPARAGQGDPPREPPPPPPPAPPPPTRAPIQAIRAYLGPHELELLQCEGHIHWVGGSTGGMYVRVGSLPKTDPGGLGVAVPPLYAERGVPLDFAFRFTPGIGAVRVNGREPVAGADGWARVPVAPGDAIYRLDVEGAGGEATFRFSCLILDGSEVTRSEGGEAPGPDDRGPEGTAPDPYLVPRELVRCVGEQRYADAYALCAGVYRAIVPLAELTAILAPLAATCRDSLGDNAISGGGGEGRRYPFDLLFEGWDRLRETVCEPRPSLLGRLLLGDRTKEVARRAPTGLEGRFTLAYHADRYEILDLSFQRFDDGGPSARRMREAEEE